MWVKEMMKKTWYAAKILITIYANNKKFLPDSDNQDETMELDDAQTVADRKDAYSVANSDDDTDLMEADEVEQDEESTQQKKANLPKGRKGKESIRAQIELKGKGKSAVDVDVQEETEVAVGAKRKATSAKTRFVNNRVKGKY
jgi:hypothetical protein